MKKATYLAVFIALFTLLMTFNLSVAPQTEDSDIAIENVAEKCDNGIQFNLGFTVASARDRNPDDCHENGDCKAVCGSGYTACSYMDCGSGTQLCHKR